LTLPRPDVEHYSLDAVIAVGYRVRSPRGVLFHQWATAQLRDLLTKSFVLDDERLKAGRSAPASASHAGRISYELAEEHAQQQFEQYERARLERETHATGNDFDRQIEDLRKTP